MKQLKDSRVDATILSAVQPHWKKVAMIIALTADKLRPDLPEGDEGYHLIAKRIQALVRNGRLRSQGNLKRWRFSEIRLP